MLPIHHDTTAFLAHRKLFDRRFRSSARNDRGAVEHCVSYPQETIRKRFPIRLDAMVLHTDRKLFAKGFLSGLTLRCFMPTGNYSRRVSHPT